MHSPHTSNTPKWYPQLAAIIAEGEDAIMARILAYAEQHGYSAYTSTLLESWRASVCGLSTPLLQVLNRGFILPPISVEQNQLVEHLSAFARLEAERHRERGIDARLFLGFLCYYRDAYVQHVMETAPDSFDSSEAIRFLKLFFDHVQLAIASEWIGVTDNERITELQRANRELAVEKTEYLSLFHSTDEATMVISEEGKVYHANRAAAELFPVLEEVAKSYAPTSSQVEIPSEIRASTLEFMEAKAEKSEWEQQISIASSQSIYHLALLPLEDLSQRQIGFALTVHDLGKNYQLGSVMHRALDADTNGVVITDEQGTIGYVNKAFETLTGWTVDEAIGNNPRILRSGFNQESFYEDMWTTIKGGKVWVGELVNQRKDGSTYYEEMTITPVRDNDGKISHYIAIKRDISERFALSLALANSEKTFRAIFQDVGVAMFDIDPNNATINKANIAAEKMLGYNSGELLNVQFAKVDVGRNPAELNSIICNLAQRNPYAVFESTHRTKSAELIDVEIHASYIHNHNDAPRILAVVHDIRERNRHRAESDAWARTMATILESIKDPMIVCDQGGYITWSNEPGRQLLGLSAANERKVKIDHLLAFGDLQSIQRALHDVSTEGAYTLEKMVIISDSGPRIFQFAVHKVEGNEGQGIGGGTVWLGNDRTDSMREDELRLQAQKLEGIGQLASGIAHEINTPIQYIGDNLRFISDGVHDIGLLINVLNTILESQHIQPEAAAQIRSTMEEIDLEFLIEELPPACSQGSEGVQRVAKIVSAMRSFAHPGSGGHSSVDLSQLVESTLIVARNEYKYIAECSFTCADSLSSIQGDSSQLGQVILNIIVNAAQAISEQERGDDKGQIAIELRNQDDGISLTVDDDGPGVPVDIRNRVFDPFFTTKEVGKGTGQGLTMVHDIVTRRHHGKIAITDSELGGARFSLWFPSSATGDNEVVQHES